MSGLTLEQQRVATLLKHDMEVSGIGEIIGFVKT